MNLKPVEMVFVYNTLEEMKKHSSALYEEGYEYSTVVRGKNGIRVRYKLVR